MVKNTINYWHYRYYQWYFTKIIHIIFYFPIYLPISFRSSSTSFAFLTFTIKKKKKKETQRMSFCSTLTQRDCANWSTTNRSSRFIGWFRCDHFTLTHYSKSHSTFVNQICKLVRVAFAISADLADRFVVNRFARLIKNDARRGV